MGRHREYANATERQRAHRAKVRRDWLETVHKVEGEHYTLYQGDALQIVPLLTGYDHCITDPPYEPEAHTRTRRTRAVLEGRDPYAPITFAPLTELQRRFLCSQRCQWLLAFCQVEAVGKYQHLLGPQYLRTAIWRKRDGAPQYTGDRPGMGYESIICAWCQGGKPHWNRGGQHGWYECAPAAAGADLIYDYPVRADRRESRLHATQKPLALLQALVRDFTQDGDVVLDPFMGSGTTGTACLELGRHFIGIEQDPATFRAAADRLAQTAAQGRLFAAARPQARQAQLL